MTSDSDRLEALVESLDDLGFATIELDGTRIVGASPRLGDIVGYSVDELLALPDVGRILPPGSRRAVLASLRGVADGRPMPSGLGTLLRRDGVPVDVHFAGRAVGSTLLGIVRDVSEETRRRDQLAAYAEVLQRMPMGMALWRVEDEEDPSSLRLVAVNRAATAGSGRTPAELVGRTIGEVFSAAGAAAQAEGVLAAHRSRRLLDLGETDAAGSDGFFAPGTYRRAVVPLPGDLVASLIENVTSRREAERHRRDLLQRVFDAGSEERRRVAVGLHDDVIQTLAATLLDIGAARGSGDPSALEHACERVDANVRAVIERLRVLVFDLAPPELEEGLAAAVEVVAAKTFAGSGTSVECEVDLAVEPDADTAMTVYRVVAEALVNARRHAGASNVRVELASDERWLTGSIADDGRGAAELVTPPGHLGLRTMRERAEVLGGVCAVRSTPGQGTVVSFRVPVHGTVG
jgi:signal transduction histidine kinase